MVDCNTQSGREFVVFAVQGEGGGSGSIPRLPCTACSGAGYPARTRDLLFVIEVRLIKELGSLLILWSPKLGLWHDSNEDWLISQSMGPWKTQNVVVQGCMFRFWILQLAHRFGMCDKTEYEAFGWPREVFLYDGSGKVTLQVKSLAVLSEIILFFSEFLNKNKYENAEVKF